MTDRPEVPSDSGGQVDDRREPGTFDTLPDVSEKYTSEHPSLLDLSTLLCLRYPPERPRPHGFVSRPF